MKKSEPLFTRKGDLRKLYESRLQMALNELERMDPPETHMDIDCIADALYVRYKIGVPMLYEGKLTLHRQNEPHPDHRKAPITLAVPFEGERECFHYRPAIALPEVPSGKVVGHELWLMYEIGDHKVDWLKKTYLAELALVQQWLDILRKEIEKHNSAFRLFLHQALAKTLTDAAQSRPPFA